MKKLEKTINLLGYSLTESERHREENLNTSKMSELDINVMYIKKNGDSFSQAEMIFLII